MERKTTVLIIGATGAQGRSVAMELLSHNRFSVRCLTRNPDSTYSKALERAGAVIVRGDLGDKESLQAAVTGCDSVFGATNFWGHSLNEYRQGINLVDIVVDSGVKQLVLSTQPYSYEATQGELAVPHFDAKGRLEAYARHKKPDTTFLHIAFYYENFIDLFSPKKGADGSYFISFPQGNAPLAAVSAEDLGGILAPVFENPETYAGQVISAVGDIMTGEEYARVLSKITGKKIHYLHMPKKTFASTAIPYAEESASMFEFYRTCKPYDMNALAQSRSLYPSIKNFEDRMQEKKALLDAVL